MKFQSPMTDTNMTKTGMINAHFIQHGISNQYILHHFRWSFKVPHVVQHVRKFEW